jgi:hypothetical protein
MATSSIYHSPATPPDNKKGHGTAALGPSDSSDSGSDVVGGPGLGHDGDGGLGLDPGTTSDPDHIKGAPETAGPDVGDANLDSDSDRYGTGERGAAGRDAPEATDEVLYEENGEPIEGEALGQDEDREDVPRGNRRGDTWR